MSLDYKKIWFQSIHFNAKYNVFVPFCNWPGIDTERSYPYTSGDGKVGTCKFNPNTVGATDSGCIQVTVGDESALQEAVATVGPISVAIDVAHGNFMSYQSGKSYSQVPHCLLAYFRTIGVHTVHSTHRSRK